MSTVQQFSGDSRQTEGGPLPGLLHVDLDVHDAVVAVRARGEVDVSTVDRFESVLSRALDTARGATELVVDLRDLVFVDGRGARSVIDVARTAADQQVPLRLLSCPALDKVLHLIGHRAGVTVEPGTGPAPRSEPDAPPGSPPASPPDGPGEYAHLMPLFAERATLPPDHPRSRRLRDALITGYLPVARNIARRFRNRGENPDDLDQVAAVGLIHAVDRFEVGRGLDFLAFAVPTITGEVQRHHRDRTATIRVPRRIRELQAQVLRAIDELSQRDGRAPRPSAIAQHVDLDVADVIEALEAVLRGPTRSLDEPSSGDPAGSENSRFSGALAVADSEVAMVVDRESVAPLLDALPDRERRILLLRFFGNRTQSEIAAELGISQMHVSRLLAATLGRLRADLNGPAGPATS